MKSDKDKQKERNRQIEKEIRGGQKFSLANAIGREGGDFLKGESPVPKLVQVITEINNFISRNLRDHSGALQAILHNWVKADQARVSQHLDFPLMALRDILEAILQNKPLLYELVRQVDTKWGEINDERPYFQQPGQDPHPDDEYTHESVEQDLVNLLKTVNSSIDSLNEI